MRRLTTYFALATFYFLFTMMMCGDWDRDYELAKIELDNFNFAEQEMIPAETSLPKAAYIMGVKCFYKASCDSEYKLTIDNLNKDRITFTNVADTLNIICNSEFNKTYPTGSDVTMLFTKSDKQLVDGDYLYFLILTEAPDPGIHSFKVVYTLKNNGGTIEADTQPIEFL